jgi:Arc/MetJ family transcription regulator
MSKPSQKKFEKKRVRDKETKKQILTRRLKERAKRREADKDERYIRKTRDRIQPYVKANDPILKLNQIERNLEVLKHLQEEYLKEEAQRESINEELEAEGYKSLKEKMDALNEKAIKLADEQGREYFKNVEEESGTE